MAEVSEPQLREAAEVQKALEAAERWLPHTDDPRFIEGAIAGFEWVLGRRSTAPVSGSTSVVTVVAVLREQETADDLIYGRATRPGVHPDFANGVQDALMWCTGDADEPTVEYE